MEEKERNKTSLDKSKSKYRNNQKKEKRKIKKCKRTNIDKNKEGIDRKK